MRNIRWTTQPVVLKGEMLRPDGTSVTATLVPMGAAGTQLRRVTFAEYKGK